MFSEVWFVSSVFNQIKGKMLFEFAFCASMGRGGPLIFFSPEGKVYRLPRTWDLYKLLIVNFCKWSILFSANSFACGKSMHLFFIRN